MLWSTYFCPVGDIGLGGPFTEDLTLFTHSCCLAALIGEVP